MKYLILLSLICISTSGFAAGKSPMASLTINKGASQPAIYSSNLDKDFAPGSYFYQKGVADLQSGGLQNAGIWMPKKYRLNALCNQVASHRFVGEAIVMRPLGKDSLQNMNSQPTEYNFEMPYFLDVNSCNKLVLDAMQASLKYRFLVYEEDKKSDWSVHGTNDGNTNSVYTVYRSLTGGRASVSYSSRLQVDPRTTRETGIKVEIAGLTYSKDRTIECRTGYEPIEFYFLVDSDFTELTELRRFKSLEQCTQYVITNLLNPGFKLDADGVYLAKARGISVTTSVNGQRDISVRP